MYNVVVQATNIIKKGDFMATKTNNLPHTRWLCKYHIVFTPMLVSIPPQISVSSFMGYLKGKSALMIFDRHTNLKYKFGNRYFCAEVFYVSTVGLNEATIKNYIQDQQKEDILKDKLSIKEYVGPFKG